MSSQDLLRCHLPRDYERLGACTKVRNGEKGRLMTHVFEIRTYSPKTHELIVDGKRIELDFLILDAAMLHAEFIARDMTANTPQEGTASLEFAVVCRAQDPVKIRRATLVLPERGLT